ncbi:DNA polymerase-like protein subunit delta-2 [Phyllosticta citrichinensis]|uniref:DNA polymerase-like protein subunit delta-2 n=1 Tax=Phyllosticta citrichinensis TaxID=1130410 RepID=A0ABR1Y5Z8_9PEZI
MAVPEYPADLLQSPFSSEFPVISRPHTPSYQPLHTFALPKGQDRQYVQQYADMYFLRLAQLKPIVEQVAGEAWASFELAGEKAQQVDRVLDVRQGQACWVVGTVFMQMGLKPDVLDDISKEHWIAAPPPREKYMSPDGTGDEIMLEDESGRLQISGSILREHPLVTGAIIAAIGSENKHGIFEVIDIRVADLPPQPERWALSQPPSTTPPPSSKKIAIVSGLNISGTSTDSLALDLLLEYLLGEAGDASSASQITRLVIAGDSISKGSPIPTREDLAMRGKISGSGTGAVARKFGYDASAYNAAPIERLDAFLAELLPSIPVTILPGASDPANVAVPQQPLHPALFRHSRAYMKSPAAEEAEPGWLDAVTNPWEGEIEGWRVLGSGGQNVNDVAKYVGVNNDAAAAEDGEAMDVDGDGAAKDQTSTDDSDRCELMDALLRWRCVAPTAPDTLCEFPLSPLPLTTHPSLSNEAINQIGSYPFQDDDPFLLSRCPHLFFAGNQPRFATDLARGPAGQLVRLVAVPRFCDTGLIVLVDVGGDEREEALGVEVVRVVAEG